MQTNTPVALTMHSLAKGPPCIGKHTVKATPRPTQMLRPLSSQWKRARRVRANRQQNHPMITEYVGAAESSGEFALMTAVVLGSLRASTCSGLGCFELLVASLATIGFASHSNDGRTGLGHPAPS